MQLSDNDPKKEGLIISIANNLLKAYDPDKIAIEVVTFGPGIDLLRPENPNRQRVESLIAQGVKFDVCLNTVDTHRARNRQAPGDHSARDPGAGRRRANSVADRKRLYAGSALRRFDMRWILRLAIAALLSVSLVSAGLAADAKSHRVSIQVDQNDPQVMNLALNNATNVDRILSRQE